MSRELRRHTAGFAVLVLLTLFKIGAWAVLAERGKVRPFVGDNATYFYIPIAHRILVEHRFNGPDSRPDSKMPPGYPLFLAAVMGTASNAFLQLVPALQMLMDLATACVVYWAAVRLGFAIPGLMAGCAWLLYPPAIAISTWVTAETAFTTFFVAGLILFALSVELGKSSWSWAGGLLMGFATMLRGTPLFLPVALLPVAFYFREIRKWAVFTVGMAILIAPWCLRNVIVLDDFIPVATGSGSVILQGSDERFFTGDGKRTFYSSTFQSAIAAGIAKPVSDHESAQDDWLGRVGFWVERTRFREHPMSVFPFFAHKLARLWYGTESGGVRQQAILGFCALLVLPAALWQLWRWRTATRGFAWVMIAALGYLAALHVATLPEARYVFPIFPVLILAACCRYYEVFHRISQAKQAGSSAALQPLAD